MKMLLQTAAAGVVAGAEQKTYLKATGGGRAGKLRKPSGSRGSLSG